MKIKITIESSEWFDNSKSKTDNWKWDRQVVMVRFENQTFRWIATYSQLDEIKNKLIECETINKELCRKYHESLK